ncbi:hypothetical protein D3C83_193610 [compost metagenome]
MRPDGDVVHLIERELLSLADHRGELPKHDFGGGVRQHQRTGSGVDRSHRMQQKGHQRYRRKRR